MTSKYAAPAYTLGMEVDDGISGEQTAPLVFEKFLIDKYGRNCPHMQRKPDGSFVSEYARDMNEAFDAGIKHGEAKQKWVSEDIGASLLRAAHQGDATELASPCSPK